VTTQDQPPADDIRPHLHAMWSGVAPGWAAYADDADARGATITDALLDLSGVGPGDRVLELACGPGGTGLAAAGRGADVVLSDVAPEMTAIAAARARDRGLRIATRELDLEEIAEPDASYDVVLCREGLMFAVDPARAAREIHRVLRPGGRVACATWGPRERNPWLAIVLDAVSEQLGAPVPPPGRPGPFALSDAGGLAGILQDAGLADVAVAEHAVEMGAADAETWWTRTCALAGPIAGLLAAMPPEASAAIRDRALAAAQAHAQDDGRVVLPGVTLLSTGRRPA
jgi:SAM-dependent methyltransferase